MVLTAGRGARAVRLGSAAARAEIAVEGRVQRTAGVVGAHVSVSLGRTRAAHLQSCNHGGTV